MNDPIKFLLHYSSDKSDQLSIDIGIKVSKFHLSYGRAAYHLAGAPNYITIRTNFSEFSRKASEN